MMPSLSGRLPAPIIGAQRGVRRKGSTEPSWPTPFLLLSHPMAGSFPERAL